MFCSWLNNNIVEVQTGGGHEVVGDYRGKGLGTKLVKECIFNNDYPIYIGQYYSTGALSILKKLGLTIFEIPQFIKIRKVGPLLQERGIKNVGVISNILDGLLKAYDLRNTIKTKKLQKLYEIKEEKIVPQWVNDFANSEERKYFEVHDREWFQWNLDNKFTCYPEDRNFFFSIYDSNRRPVGFFVTKERFEEHVEGHRWNSLRGTILEWGIDKKSSLTEADINLLALATFSSNVDRIITVISDTQDLRTIQKLGFIRHGNYQMSIRVREDFAKEIPEDFFDQANWRIRYGGCNTALV